MEQLDMSVPCNISSNSIGLNRATGYPLFFLPDRFVGSCNGLLTVGEHGFPYLPHYFASNIQCLSRRTRTELVELLQYKENHPRQLLIHWLYLGA
ncbi:hypothetical protein CK203_032571 [Vitis vinifera]|uniref:Uncharacterized protein n=1 Tax=Vitis vinifera TaxID=29760 RepID=A0A438HXK0_VITVI|nr:hypothetical protein CK203_032571 [Vitis vinifera]